MSNWWATLQTDELKTLTCNIFTLFSHFASFVGPHSCLIINHDRYRWAITHPITGEEIDEVVEGVEYQLQCFVGYDYDPATSDNGVWQCLNGRWVQTAECIEEGNKFLCYDLDKRLA